MGGCLLKVYKLYRDGDSAPIKRLVLVAQNVAHDENFTDKTAK